MGGKRIRDYWTLEMKSLLDRYCQFETLIPASSGKGAAHRGEDGRYVESILKETLRKFLPSGMEILSGFILRAGVKSEFSGKARKEDDDYHSSQLDLIIYDSERYPVYQRFGDTAVVLPEGVIAIISVKKTLSFQDVKQEIPNLYRVSKLCSFKNRKGPFLALVSMDSGRMYINKNFPENIYNVMEDVAKKDGHPICYESMIGFIGDLSHWTIHKIHHKEKKSAEFQLYTHEEGEEPLGFQFLIDGILDTYYAVNNANKPGYVNFPKGKEYVKGNRIISYDRERSERIKNDREKL